MLEWGVDVEIDALVAIARREPGKRLEPGDEVGTAIGIARIVERVDADAYILRAPRLCEAERQRSEEHTSELQSLMRISYAVFCLKKKKEQQNQLKIQRF